jgi:hypothetical protein
MAFAHRRCADGEAEPRNRWNASVLLVGNNLKQSRRAIPTFRRDDAELARNGRSTGTQMIDSTHVKAHRSPSYASVGGFEPLHLRIAIRPGEKSNMRISFEGRPAAPHCQRKSQAMTDTGRSDSKCRGSNPSAYRLSRILKRSALEKLRGALFGD